MLDLVERVSVNIGLAVNGAGVGSFATPAQGMGSGSNVWAWAAPTEGCSLQLGGSIIAHKPDLAVLEAATTGRAVTSPALVCISEACNVQALAMTASV